jgi:Mg2+/Co2+ transporter CorC
MEDLLESLFGEIQDEYDPEVSLIQSVEDGTAIVSAQMPVEEFNRRFGAHLPEEEYDTLGGLVFDLFGRLPEPGLEVSYMRHTFRVEKTRGPRILELRVQLHADSAEAPDSEDPALAREAGNKEDG